jgi:riboflavin synthase
MFTGIVEELGAVAGIERGADSARLTVHGPLVTSDATPGASIAVNGVCLTVAALIPDRLIPDRLGPDRFVADVMRETLDRSSLGGLAAGSPVNLERPLAADGRFGGHVVQGHVDGTGRIVRRRPGDNWEVLTIELPRDLAGYVVLKGSITVDGVSLTVSGLDDVAGTFEVSLIPATLEHTTLGRRDGAPDVGRPVNLEVDVLAKYVERLLGARAGAGPR